MFYNDNLKENHKIQKMHFFGHRFIREPRQKWGQKVTKITFLKKCHNRILLCPDHYNTHSEIYVSNWLILMSNCVVQFKLLLNNANIYRK